MYAKALMENREAVMLTAVFRPSLTLPLGIIPYKNHHSVNNKLNKCH